MLTDRSLAGRLIARERLSQAVRLLRDVLAMEDVRPGLPGLLRVIHEVETMENGLRGDGGPETPPVADRPEPGPESSAIPEPFSERLTWDRDISEGSPVIRGSWVTVSHVVSLIVDGWSWSDILRTHPEIGEADIRACVAYTVHEANEGPEAP